VKPADARIDVREGRRIRRRETCALSRARQSGGSAAAAEVPDAAVRPRRRALAANAPRTLDWSRPPSRRARRRRQTKISRIEHRRPAREG
jgi:hypothetical protein